MGPHSNIESVYKQLQLSKYDVIANSYIHKPAKWRILSDVLVLVYGCLYLINKITVIYLKRRLYHFYIKQELIVVKII